ncbi:hypothetical protein [Acinetobacter gandensis]|uniref:hypothetical protein n=1 Tax=Acinetobacter gandensis TaxID=1443941 RepID=UPI003989F9C9
MPAPLSFLTLELTSKVKDPIDVPDIIKSTILTRIKKSSNNADNRVQYLYDVNETLWKPRQLVTQEAVNHHGLSNELLSNKDSIAGLKIKNYIVYWANVYTFRILQLSKVKFYNHRFIFLNNLLNVIGEDGTKSMNTWAKTVSKVEGLNIDDEILKNPNNKAICLTIVFDYIAQKFIQLYGFDINKHYDLVAAVQYNSALKAKEKKSLKVHKVMSNDFIEIKKLIDSGHDVKGIKKQYFEKHRYSP